MKLGSFTIEQLSEGNFEISASGSITRMGSNPRSSDYAAMVGIDPLLILHDNKVSLLDAGIGLGLDAKGHTEKLSNLHTNLSVFGIKPEQVERVILSHLHYDHIAGLSLTDRAHKTIASLPEAKIYVHQKEWDHVLAMFDKPKHLGIGYDLDDFYRLVADGRVEFLQEDYTRIADGIEVIRTGGHSPGHMIVRISSEGQIGYYFGDLIPSEVFLHVGVKGLDEDPIESKGLRMFWLRQAYDEKAWIFFYHSVQVKYGRLERDQNRQFTVRAEQ